VIFTNVQSNTEHLTIYTETINNVNFKTEWPQVVQKNKKIFELKFLRLQFKHTQNIRFDVNVSRIVPIWQW